MVINPLPEIFISNTIDNKLQKKINMLGCKKVYIVTGPHVSKTAGFLSIIESLEQSNIVGIFYDTTGDPSLQLVDTITKKAKLFDPDIILGIGGGSPLDAAKIVSILVTSSKKSGDLLNSSIPERKIPLILIPTSAGTGSEITPISILTDEENSIKTGIIDNTIIPDMAFLYGELTVTMPPSVTAATGMDALCHAMEAYFSKRANGFSNIWAKEALILIGKYFLPSFNNPANVEYRSKMLLASLYAGIAFSNASVTAVHAFAYPLGALYKIPHGLANAMMLIPVLKHNLPSIGDKIPDICDCLSINRNSESLIIYLKSLKQSLELPECLEALNIPEEGIDIMAEKVLEIDRLLSVNPRDIILEDSKRIYKEAYYAS